MHRLLIISVLIALFLNKPVLQAGTGTDPAGSYYETVNIITDRDLYIAGERLYFRLEVMNRDNGPVSGLAYLVLRNPDNTVIVSSSLQIAGNTGHGSIYLTDTLRTSAYQLVAYTNWMRNFGEDHYATRQIVIVNRFDEELNPLWSEYRDLPDSGDGKYPESAGDQVEAEAEHPYLYEPSMIISPDKRVYGTREKVRVELVPGSFKASYATISVSVAQKQTFLPAVSGRHEVTAQIKAGASPPGKSRYFYKEASGPVISGQVTGKNNMEGISGTTAIMTTPDTIVNMLFAKTLDDGTFHFMLNDYHEGKMLHFSLYDTEIAGTADIRLDDKFSLENPFRPLTEPIAPTSESFIRTSQNITRINKILGIELHRIVGRDRHGYRPEIYSAPAQKFDAFHEYEYLGNMHEIARELMPFLRIRRQGNTYTSNIMLEFTDRYTQESPVFFLDGIYTDDINRIIHLDSDDLKKMELHNYLWRTGDVKFPGIIALFSNKQIYRNIKLSEPSVTFENHPAASGSLYRPPDYEKDDIIRSRPDFRQLLYWNPEITVEKAGGSKVIQFYSGDLKGEFIIRVNGYTSSGELISRQSSIHIGEASSVSGTDRIAGYRDNSREDTINAGDVPVKSTLTEKVFPETGPDKEDLYKYFEQGLSGRLNMPPRRPIGNQHYLSEEWLTGSVILENGQNVRDKFLRYNGYLDELFWLYEGDYQQVEVDRYMVREFTLNEPLKVEPLRFRRIDVYAPLLIGKSDIFGEVLYEGGVSLYAYRRIIETERGDYRIGNRLYGGIFIKPSHIYIFKLPDGSTLLTRKIRRRYILDMFPESRREVRSLLRESRIRPRSEAELIETARILDNFFSGN